MSVEPTYDNQDTAEHLRREVRQREADRQEAVGEQLSLKAKLEQARDEQTIDIEIDGLDVAFRPMSGADSRRVLKIGQRWAALEESGDVEAVVEKVDGFAAEIYRMLAEYAVDDDLDEAFWESTYSLGEAIEHVRTLMEGGGPSREEVTEFR